MSTQTQQTASGLPLSAAEARAICERFALKHKVIFDDKGECGFGRKCVGFCDGGNWIAHNPYRHSDYEPIPGLACADCYAPAGVNSYHKHDCLAVLGHGDEAIIGLARWVQKMEAAGEVHIVKYRTGATGMQALIAGTHARAVIVKKV
ncbi:MAG: hypothetical protein LBK99_16605 [Opitutaceae bacterium]|jgi:hypothetical protein|nr:hypothetical protein [Opitutaceae bacterium]